MGKSELERSARELNRYVIKLQRVPIEVGRFIGAVAERINRLTGTRAARHGSSGSTILLSDVVGAFGISEQVAINLANQLSAYGLGSIQYVDEEMETVGVVIINHVGDWPFWIDLAEFCKKAPESMEAFTVDLDFARLDE